MAERGVALVTGAAGRIGRAIAVELASHHDIVIHYHRDNGGAEATLRQALAQAEEAGTVGAEGWVIGADLTHGEDAAALLPRAAQMAGRPVNHVIHNASRFPRQPLLDASWREMEEMMRIHAWPLVTFGRHMAGRPGTLTALLDTRVRSRDPHHGAYHLSKQAAASLVPELAMLLAPHVRVNGIAPGPILPPNDGTEDPDAALARHGDAVPLRRPGTPEEVAQAAAYLIRADYVTGQVLFVDGGRHVGTS